MRKFAPILLIFLSVSAFAQIPNSDFENWSMGPVLDDWQTNSAPGTLPPYDPYTVRQSTDSYSGTYCADLFANGVFKPYMETTFPVSAHPEKLSFYWKSVFAPCVNDSGFVEQDTLTALVQLLYNGSVVDSGFWSYSGSLGSNYQLAEVNFTNSSTQYDSCWIRFEGGAILGGCGIVQQSTEFFVDEASLSYFPNSIADNEAVEFQMFPNPASSSLTLSVTEFHGNGRDKYLIVEPSGRIILSESFNSSQVEINIESVSSGVYLVILLRENDVVSKQRLVVR